MKNLSVVIPAAGLGRRLKQGSKSLLEIGGRPLISRQLTVLRKVFPTADFVVVVGYEADKVRRVLPNWVRVVENENFEATNVARSLSLGVQVTLGDNLLVVYGDLVFDPDTFVGFPPKESAILAQTQAGRPYEVGVTVAGGSVTTFSYGLDTIWSHILFLTGWELNRFRRLLSESHRKRYFGFEVLNDLLQDGGKLNAVVPDKLRLAEIDTPADLRQARTLFPA